MAKRRKAANSKARSRAHEIARGRLARLRKAIKPLGVSHAVITNPVDVGYLTGFLGGDSVLIAGAGKPTIVSDRRYEEELDAFRPVAKIAMRSGAMTPAIADVLADLRDKKKLDGFAIQSDHMTAGVESALRDSCKSRKIPVRSIAHADGLVTALRMAKDAGEIKLIKAAAAIQQDALLAALEYFRTGMTELDFTAELEYQMKIRGSSTPAFGTIVAAGANGSHPHYHPSAVPIRGNSTLLIDWGATWMGYRSDMTHVRRRAAGRAQMREIYGIVLDAHEAAAAAIKPGITGRELDAIARRVISEAGYGEAFAHSLGHGLGMDVHEMPRLSSQSGDVLEEGHVVTIEPGIYLPGIGGVRIEDDYAVTARGRRISARCPATSNGQRSERLTRPRRRHRTRPPAKEHTHDRYPQTQRTRQAHGRERPHRARPPRPGGEGHRPPWQQRAGSGLSPGLRGPQAARRRPRPASNGTDASAGGSGGGGSDDGLVAIESPMVGTFYSASNPDSPPSSPRAARSPRARSSASSRR